MSTNTTNTILLVDDSEDDLEFYTDLLQQCDQPYRVVTAQSGKDAIAHFTDNHIDCILIDYNLPEMDGLEILDQITLHSTTTAATIILTGEPTQHIQAEAARQGALNYLVKDVNVTPQRMQQVIEQTISWAKKL